MARDDGRRRSPCTLRRLIIFTAAVAMTACTAADADTPALPPLTAPQRAAAGRAAEEQLRIEELLLALPERLHAAEDAVHARLAPAYERRDVAMAAAGGGAIWGRAVRAVAQRGSWAAAVGFDLNIGAASPLGSLIAVRVRPFGGPPPTVADIGLGSADGAPATATILDDAGVGYATAAALAPAETPPGHARRYRLVLGFAPNSFFTETVLWRDVDRGRVPGGSSGGGASGITWKLGRRPAAGAGALFGLFEADRAGSDPTELEVTVASAIRHDVYFNPLSYV